MAEVRILHMAPVVATPLSAGADSAMPSITCIVVEDHTDTRDGYVEFLALEGITVLSAGGSEEFRALLATSQPDAIVMDLHLPRVDGWTLIRELRAAPATQDVPVLVVSAYVREVDREDAFRAGASAFIGKPCDPNDVAAELKRLVNARRGTGPV
jgi:CheY-like chemotaxis protein